MNNAIKKPETLKAAAINIESLNNSSWPLKPVKGTVKDKSRKKDEIRGISMNAHKIVPHVTKKVLRTSSLIRGFNIFSIPFYLNSLQQPLCRIVANYNQKVKQNMVYIVAALSGKWGLALKSLSVTIVDVVRPYSKANN